MRYWLKSKLMKYAVVQILETGHLAELSYSHLPSWGWQKHACRDYYVKNERPDIPSVYSSLRSFRSKTEELHL